MVNRRLKPINQAIKSCSCDTNRDYSNSHKVLIDIAKYDCLYVTYKSDSFCNNVINYRGRAGQNVQASEKLQIFVKKILPNTLFMVLLPRSFEKE